MPVADPVSRLADALTEIAGVPVALERPGGLEHGDYATNVALRLAPTQGRSPRDIAAGIGSEALEHELVESAEPAGAGIPQPARIGCMAGSRVARDPRRRRVFRWRHISRSRADPGRDGLRQPHRPADRRDGSERRLRRLGRAAARLRWERRRARVLLQRRGNADGAISRLGRSRAAGEEPPEDGYRGDYITELARSAGDPVPAMLERIEETLERFRVHFDTWVLQSDVESEIPESIALLDTYESEGRSGRERAHTATTRIAFSSVRTESPATTRRTPPTFAESTREVSIV